MMKRISEVISELEKFKTQYGDIAVCVDHSDYRPRIEEGVEIMYSPSGALASDNETPQQCIIVM